MANVERLQILVDGLKTVPKAKFNLGGWRLGEGSDVDLLTGCGTQACAVGWACVMPEFVKEGLFFNGYSPQVGDVTGWRAVERFFGLTEEEADLLFYQENYEEHDNIDAVIERIQECIREYS